MNEIKSDSDSDRCYQQNSLQPKYYYLVTSDTVVDIINDGHSNGADIKTARISDVMGGYIEQVRSAVSFLETGLSIYTSTARGPISTERWDRFSRSIHSVTEVPPCCKYT